MGHHINKAGGGATELMNLAGQIDLRVQYIFWVHLMAMLTIVGVDVLALLVARHHIKRILLVLKFLIVLLLSSLGELDDLSILRHSNVRQFLSFYGLWRGVVRVRVHILAHIVLLYS